MGVDRCFNAIYCHFAEGDSTPNSMWLAFGTELDEVRPQPSDHDDEEELHSLKIRVSSERA